MAVFKTSLSNVDAELTKYSPIVQIWLSWGRGRADHRESTILERTFKTDRRSSM